MGEMKKLYRLVVPGQLDIILPADREGIIETLQARFPAESDQIRAFFDLVYKFFMELVSVHMFRDPDASPEKYPTYFKYALVNSQEVLDQYFSDPLLKLAVAIYWCYMGLPPSTLSFSDLCSLIFAYTEFKPYHLKGGSQALSSAILDKFLQSGGEARFNCTVGKILVEDGRVHGVVTDRGDIIKAPYVVSNASALSVYTEMLAPDQVPHEQLKTLSGSTIGPSAFTLYIGLDCAPEDVGIYETTNFICPHADMDISYSRYHNPDTDGDAVLLTCYNISDPDASPPGTSQVAIADLKYGEPWLAVAPHEYYTRKYQYAEKLLQLAEEVYPGLREHIEEIEVATPLTHMRYLATPGGAIYGFDQYAKDSNMFLSPRAPYAGLYFVGAWAGSGGFQPTLMSGGTAARFIIKDFKSKAEVKA
jgi:prolycopene isomerase